MTDPAHRRFDFDTVFDGDGDVAQPSVLPKRVYVAAEVEQIRAQAYAEGEHAAMSRIEAAQAQALAEIAQTARAAFSALAAVAHDHRAGTAELSLACAKAIADAALERFPEAPVRAALEALAREVEAAPRLIATAPPQMAEQVQAILAETAQSIGYAGQILVKPTPGLARAAFTLDFGDGAATFDPAAAAERVGAALAAALAAEGLHAEAIETASED
jgi:flagellar assembly protein FliH